MSDEIAALRKYVETIEERLADLEVRIGPRLTAEDRARIAQKVEDEWAARRAVPNLSPEVPKLPKSPRRRINYDLLFQHVSGRYPKILKRLAE